MIEIRCDYDVYDSEWIEIQSAIAELLKEYMNGKYSNLDINVLMKLEPDAKSNEHD